MDTAALDRWIAGNYGEDELGADPLADIEHEIVMSWRLMHRARREGATYYAQSWRRNLAYWLGERRALLR